MIVNDILRSLKLIQMKYDRGVIFSELDIENDNQKTRYRNLLQEIIYEGLVREEQNTFFITRKGEMYLKTEGNIIEINKYFINNNSSVYQQNIGNNNQNKQNV